MALKLANFASSQLAVAVNSAATTLTITSGTEGRFPTLSAGDWFPLVVVDSDGDTEIMRCTARSGVVLTVDRGREGTSAKSFTTDARAEIRLTGAALAALPAFLPTIGGTLSGALTIDDATPRLVWSETDGGKEWHAFVTSGSLYIAEDDSSSENRRLYFHTGGLIEALSGFKVTGAFELAGDVVQIDEGGTGGDSPEEARTNLEVYSRAEMDDALEEKASLTGAFFNGLNYALRGKTTSAAGAGVRGESANGTAYGMLGYNNVYAFYGQGNFRLEGNGTWEGDLDLTGDVGVTGDFAVTGDASFPGLTLTAGAGLTGGGSLADSRTFNLGTPSSISNTSTNAATDDSHSHALGFVAAEVHQGTTASETSFPLGHLICCTIATGGARNEAKTPRLHESDDAVYTDGGAGSALSGTWRCRGRPGDGIRLLQRTA